MQGDDLVAQHVVAGLELGGNLDGAAEVGRDQRVGRPVARVAAADVAGLRDLGPRQGGGGCGGEVCGEEEEGWLLVYVRGVVVEVERLSVHCIACR